MAGVLSLSRSCAKTRPDRSVVVLELADGRDIEVTVVSTNGEQARLAFRAPDDVRIRRSELPSRRPAKTA